MTEHAHRLRRDILWNLAPVVLLAGVGLGMNFLIGTAWGAEALGAFNLVTTALFAFAVLGAAGLQFAVLRAIAERPDDPDRVAAVVVGALVPAVGFAAASTAAFVLLRGVLGDMLGSPAVTTGIAWAAPGLFCFALNKVLLGVVNGLRRMRAFAVYTSVRYLLIAGALAAALVSGMPGPRLPVIWSIAEGALLVVLAVETLASVRRGRAHGWRAWTARHLDYGLRGVLATLAYEVNTKLDVWMLGMALPDGPVGIYSLASALFEGALQLSIVLQANVNPLIARHLARGEVTEVERLVRGQRRWFVPVVVGCCAIGAASYPVIIPWLIGDPAFAAGAAPFAILMGGVALTSPWLPFNQLLLMAGHPGWHTIYVVGVVLSAYVANLLLIPPLGLVGAALGAGGALVVSAVTVRALGRVIAGVRL